MNIGIKDVLRRINVFFILYLTVLVACLIIKAVFTREEIFFAVNHIYSYPADEFFKYYTHMGDGLTTIGLAIILLVFVSYRSGFLLITSYAISSGVAQIIKYSVNAPRPGQYFIKRLGDIHFVEGVYIYIKRSFPSGHSVTAFSTALVLSYLCSKKQWGAVFFVLAVLAGYSRMYLSEHFFEDVVAGSVIGVITTLLWLSWVGRKAFLQRDMWSENLFGRFSR